MSAVAKAKNERYRMASTLEEGMEVQTREDGWVRITEHWYFTAPLRVVSMTLEGGIKVNLRPRDQVMSRWPEEG